MSFLSRTGFVAAALAASSIACAQVYVGGSIGQSSTSFSNDFSSNIAGISENQDKTDTAYKFFAGYEFTKNWAIEAGYANLGKPQVNYSGFGISGSAEIENSSWFIDAKATLPLNEQFSLFGKLGWAINKSELTANSNNAALNAAVGFPSNQSKSTDDVHYAVGASYSFNQNFSARLEYEDFGKFGNSDNTGSTKSSMWSVGAGYRF
jgi:OOP family OmpA-OmpF porin